MEKTDMTQASFDDFTKLDIRVGEITKCEHSLNAHKPAYKIWVDFGDIIGEKKSSAQITERYEPEDLIGEKVLAVINFPEKQVADIISEVLILGIYTDDGVSLVMPKEDVPLGSKLG